MRSRHRRVLIAGVGCLFVLVVAVVLAAALYDGDGFGSLDGDGSKAWQYLTIFFFIAADAVIPIFPSESTLNTASNLAADGVLDLPLVILMGALGAFVGDSALYWLARTSGTRIQRRLDKAKQKKKVAEAFDLLGKSAPVLIVGGRYVPGLRFVVNATMGLTAYPYRRFLLWSAIGASTWSVYTCVLAYSIGTALADYPLASIVASGAVTAVILATVFFVVRRGAHTQTDVPDSVAP